MFNSCICVDPDELCTLLSRKRLKARKEYKCTECRHVIQLGDVYEEDATLFDGNFATYRTCLTCVRIRDTLFTVCGWYYGGMWEEIHEAYCGPEDGECICP